MSLLREWLAHNDASFHHIKDARAIRTRLLEWYDQHRRKLPWRGDPSPWDGSTADFAKKSKQKKLDAFFKKEEREQFPVTAYGVWVSEIMLQQTRVEAVIPYWVKWMKRFPTVQDLAQADADAVNSHWAGLGFYRRARLLHQGAQYVVNECDGKIPETKEGLLKLPGVGPYTAAAVASIVFAEPVAVVDGNVCRVLSRLTGIANNVKAPALKDKYGWELATQIVQAELDGRYGDVNQALMELGATYCAPSGTGIESGDPLREFYMSTRLGEVVWLAKKEGLDQTDMVATSQCPVCSEGGVEEAFSALSEEIDTSIRQPGAAVVDAAKTAGHRILPLAPPKTAKREEVLAVAVIQSGDKYLLRKRPDEGLLAGQWEFPSVCVWNSDENSGEKGKKRKDMSGSIPVIDHKVRSRALTAHLSETSSCDPTAFGSRKLINDSAIEHVFSHVRHSMWLEYCKIEQDSCPTFPTSDIKFMSEEELMQVGVTSGVKKILRLAKVKAKQL